jgi:hypothetical protein
MTTSNVYVRFDTSHLSPQNAEHIQFVIREYLKRKGVEWDGMTCEIVGGTNAK